MTLGYLFAIIWIFEIINYSIGYLVWKLERSIRFKDAIKNAKKIGKPLINVGCGNEKYFSGMSDVNVDVVDRRAKNFIKADVHNLSMFKHEQFGSSFISHIIEHVRNPKRAMKELKRISHNVFVVVPSFLFIDSWVHPDHRRVFFYPFNKKSMNINWRLNLTLLAALNIIILAVIPELILFSVLYFIALSIFDKIWKF